MNKEQELKQQFLLEVSENIQQLENFFQQLKINPHLDLDKINHVMRAAHSIKGGSAIMGLHVLSDLAHRWEDYLKVLKVERKQIAIDNHLIELCLNGVDCLRQLVAAYADNLSLTAEIIAEQFQPIFSQLSDHFGEPVTEDMTTILATETDNHEAIALMFSTQIEMSLQRLSDLITTNSPQLNTELMNMTVEFDGLGQMFEIQAFVLACEAVMQHLDSATQEQEVKNIAQAALQLWRKCQQSILANQYDAIPTTLDLSTPPEKITPTTRRDATCRPKDATCRVSTSNQIHPDPSLGISPQQIETITELSRELTINQHRLQSELHSIHTLTRNLHHVIRQIDIAHQQTQRTWQKLTNSQPLANPLPNTTTAITKLKEIAIDMETRLSDALDLERNLDKTAHNLQTHIHQVSLRPLSDLFQRFPRALTELCHTYGKDVKLIIQGGDILVEKAILDALKEPLTHLFRNAFDHGIEPPSQRIATGKPPQGVIKITAHQSPNHTVITITDDGNGIDLQRIRDRAIKMGLDPILLQQASEADILSLIFEPGFSTSETVTELSGRGVGMDVVRNHLKQIQGEVTVNTKLGQGTTFTLSLPLQTSLMRVLLIESDRTLVAIPKHSVQAVLSYSPSQVYKISSKDYYKYENTILPLIRLANCWQYQTPRPQNPSPNNPTINTPTILIVESNHISEQSPQTPRQLIAIQVERYWQEQEVILRPVEGNIPLPPGFSNATILRDGRVVPLLNLPELLYTIASQTSSPSHQPSIPQFSKPTILLVDDSVNVRRIVAHRLQQQGYSILEAENGLEALKQLQNHPHITAIISDIDMPQLNGYGLLEKLQLKPETAAIPVMILSSHNCEKYREKAFHLGAKAYLKKPCNEHELLQMISALMEARK
ncbi:hybrid sensor histidine kinase/response regulator [Calothrix sp. NIES-3974]|uniref:hybrid sensor histidine kinase/response regulator n=1 Tax=Calothrix sp. NIES-3974 TaxID=2005462 RepID=UPI000B5E7E48|nr:hybrid sensor histidine kinase/response regulator [Calothrix sp. NIES-3974]BAZ04921.1 two-component hybrid sensor and regulator [Calothrix sp. NIES-3974]